MRQALRKYIMLFLARILARPLLLLFRSTLSIRVYKRSYVRKCHDQGENILYAIWHENMILPLLVHEKQGIHALVSQHFDGEIIANILKSFGYSSIRGSSTRGGKEAFHKMKRVVATRNLDLAFTPDGPRGPRRQSKSGIIRLAAETGAPIIPMAVAADKIRRLRSWDKFLIILPFARCSLVYHEPLYIPHSLQDRDIQFFTQELTRVTNALEEEAERCLQV